VVGIGAERLVVLIFGVVIAAKLAARITEQRCHIRVVVIAHGAQSGDAAFKVALVVDEPIGGAYPLAETVNRLKKDVADKGIMFFSEIDQSELAAKAGIKLLPRQQARINRRN
jgi:hypothetical protein